MFNRLWPFGFGLGSSAIPDLPSTKVWNYAPGDEPWRNEALPMEQFVRHDGHSIWKDCVATDVCNEHHIKALKHCLFIGETYSKDPSTKLGSLILRPDRTPVSWGYNGFARGVDDTEERLNDRDMKYKLVVHGEVNAIIHARESLKGCTLYVAPLFPCERCAPIIINAGISRVVAAYDTTIEYTRIDKDLTKTQFREASVEFIEYDISTIV